MSLPVVSIITPVYNAAKYIEETVDSVLAQDYPELDYIVLDDGSTDATSARLRRYTVDSRVRLLAHPNMGEAKTVNRGVREARGEIIAVVNADDPILPGLVLAAVALLQSRPDCAAVYPDWLRIDGSGATIAEMRVHEFDYRVLFEQHLCLPGPGVFIRRSALGSEPLRDERFRFKGDYYLWLRLGLRFPLTRLPGTYATWREHPEGTSQGNRGRAMAEEDIAVIEALLARPDCPAALRAQHRRALSTACYCAGLLAIHSRSVPGRRLLLRSLLLAPVWPRCFMPERHRAWSRIFYIFAQPVSRWLYAACGGAVPAR
jgi:glycosyltransferase involved in cell wall biosynthesis